MGDLAKLRKEGGNATLRLFGLALGGLALSGLALGGEDSEEAGLAAFGEEGGIAAFERLATLEESFFDLLWRCESPILEERNAAEDDLFERFAEFESVWQDRRFLTNGEIGAEARRRFALAEARYREKRGEEAVESLQATFEMVAAENARGENGVNRGDGIGVGDVGGGTGEVGGLDGVGGGIGDALRGRVVLRWGEALRIVYWTPDWSAFERRDVDGERWRPRGRFSAPEIAPEFDATELTLEIVWERVDEEDGGEEEATQIKAIDAVDAVEAVKTVGMVAGVKGDAPFEQVGAFAEDAGVGGRSETSATVVGVVEGLVGGDFRIWPLPLGPVASDNWRNGGDAESAGNGEDERGWGKEVKEEEGGVKDERANETSKRENETANERKVEGPSVFQSGDAIANVGETTINEKGETTARVRFEFAEAFDAFDSHRVAFDKEDFVLIIDGDESVSPGSERGEVAGKRWKPIRWRVRERSARGALFELDFPYDAALRQAASQGRARLHCRVPRFFLRARIEISGKELLNGVDFSDCNGAGGGRVGQEDEK